MRWNDAVLLSEVCAVLCPYCAGKNGNYFEKIPRLDYRDQFDQEHDRPKAWIHREVYGGIVYWKHTDCRAAVLLMKLTGGNLQVPQGE